MEDKCAADFALTESQAEEFYLYLQSLPEYKLLFDTGIIIYKDGEFSGDTDLIKGIDIFSDGNDTGAVIRFTFDDFENCTVTTDYENLCCNIVSPFTSSYSSLRGTDLSVTFNVSERIVSSEGNIKEYSQALAYDDNNIVIANGTDETKVVMAADDEMTVSTESGGNVRVDFIADGEHTKTEEVKSDKGITIIDNGSELEIADKSETEPTVYGLAGDIDNNNVLTANDAACLLHYVLNNEDLNSDWNLTKTDVNGDESLSAADAALILAKVLNSSAAFAIE